MIARSCKITTKYGGTKGNFMNRSKIKLEEITTSQEGTILTKLWRNILHDTNYINNLEYLVNRYVNKTKSSVKMVNRRTKSSLIKNMTAKDMSWKTFVDLIFNVLDIKFMTVSIKLDYADGSSTVHHIKTAKPTIEKTLKGTINGTDENENKE